MSRTFGGAPTEYSYDAAGNLVRITLPDGKVFDSTRGGDPITFPLNQLIPGWREGIPGMMVGGERDIEPHAFPCGRHRLFRAVPGRR